MAKKRVAKLYNLTAHLYDRRYREEQLLKYKAILSKVRLGEGLKIIDVGCGTGLLLKIVAEYVDLSIGVDSSINMLKKSLKRLGKKRSTGLVLADADNLPFKNHAFNVAFSITLIQNMPKPLQTLKETMRTLCIGGVATIATLKKFMDADSLRRLMFKAGFKDVYTWTEDSLADVIATGKV